MDKNQLGLAPANFFVVRAPSFPYNRVKLLNIAIVDCDIIKIRSLLMDPFFLNAVYLSSKQFYRVAKSWLTSKDIRLDYEDPILQSLYRYYVRICTRATPYGLFAGYGVGSVSDDSKITLDTNRVSLKTRVDILSIVKIRDNIIKNDSLKNDIELVVNNTLYKVEKGYRYVYWNDLYEYEIVEVETENILDLVIAFTQEGDNTRTKLTDKIVKIYPELTRDQISSYLQQLINEKVLLYNLPPYILTKMDPTEQLYGVFQKKGISTLCLLALKETQERINMTTVKSNEFIELMEKLATKYSETISEDEQMMQIDLRLGFLNCEIKEHILNRLIEAVCDLQPLVQEKGDSNLVDFSDRFLKRFGCAEVPLVEAVDPQMGVGYGSLVSGSVEETPLLENIDFPPIPLSTLKGAIPSMIKIILEKYLSHLSLDCQNPIVLDENDLKKATQYKASRDYDFGGNAYLYGAFCCSDLAGINSGKYKFLCFSQAPTRNVEQILSRFAYKDAELEKHLRQTVARDEPESIIVELDYHLDNRLSNVLMRPNLYNYQLSYVSNSDKEKSSALSIRDIFVRVQDSKIKLRSKSLNRDIKVKFSNAYIYGQSYLPVIKLLGDLQFYDSYPGFYWDWSVLEDCEYLPRVEYKKIILCEARWLLHKDSKMNLKKLYGIRLNKKIPNLCKIKHRDNVLCLDLNNKLCCILLINEIKTHDVRVYEHISSLQLPDTQGKLYNSEFIIPLVYKKKNIRGSFKNKPVRKVVKETFLPGEDWTFFKIYTNHLGADRILTEVIQPYIDEIERKNNGIEWFFIRYNDPDFHVRLRLRISIDKLNIMTLQKLLRKVTPEHPCDLIIDTYRRELERYSTVGIELVERYFYYDSIIVTEMIKLNLAKESRWKTLLLSINSLMADFSIELNRRVQILEAAYRSLLIENANIGDRVGLKSLKKSIDCKYRLKRSEIEKCITETEAQSNISGCLKKRTQLTKEVVKLLRSCFVDNEERFDQLIIDLIHMNANRILVANARRQELIIYFFLRKAYKTLLLKKY